ncbi:MAG: hypothetical protein ACO2O2_13575 [Acidilobaceae archaeon]
MGHVRVEAKLANPITGEEIKVTALVDTGATFTVIPWRVYEKSNLKIAGRKRVKTFKGYLGLDESFAVVETKGRRGVTPLLVSRELSEVLVGVVTLEILGLAVDPTTGKLRETRILLL